MESNHHRRLRKPVYYPLYYETGRLPRERTQEYSNSGRRPTTPPEKRIES